MPDGDDDLARHRLKPNQRCGCRPMLTINDGELATFDGGDNDGRKTRPGERTRDPVHIPSTLADNRALICRVDHKFVDLDPLQHRSGTGTWRFRGFEAFGRYGTHTVPSRNFRPQEWQSLGLVSGTAISS